MTKTRRAQILRSVRSPVILATATVATTSSIAAITLALMGQGVWSVLILGIALIGIAVGTTVTQRHRAMLTATKLRRIDSAIVALTDAVGADRGTERIFAEIRALEDGQFGVEERLGRQITEAHKKASDRATDNIRGLDRQVNGLNQQITDVQQRIRALENCNELAKLGEQTGRHAENAERRAMQRHTALVKFIKTANESLAQSEELGEVQTRLDEVVEMHKAGSAMYLSRDASGPTASARDIELILAHLLATPPRGTE